MKLYLSIAFTIMFLMVNAQRISFSPIPNFNIEKYMGLWYEVARIDNRFQRNMIDVTATYTLKSNGIVKVLNKGYSTKSKKWKSANGRAKGTDTPNHLKVSFFPLTSGNYWVVYVDENYSVAVVSGGKPGYLWLLSRTPTISADVKAKLLKIASENGHDINRLIYTRSEMPLHNTPN